MRNCRPPSITARTSSTAIKTTTRTLRRSGSLRPWSSTRWTTWGHTRPSAVEPISNAPATARFTRYGPTKEPDHERSIRGFVTPKERPEDVVRIETDRRRVERERGGGVAERRGLHRPQARDDTDRAELRGDRLRDALRIRVGGRRDDRIREVDVDRRRDARVSEQLLSAGHVKRRERDDAVVVAKRTCRDDLDGAASKARVNGIERVGWRDCHGRRAPGFQPIEGRHGRVDAKGL